MPLPYRCDAGRRLAEALQVHAGLALAVFALPRGGLSLAREGVEAGRRNTTIASFTGHLLWHGVDLEVVTELMLAWNRQRCHPPLPDEEVVRTVHSIEATHRRHRRGTEVPDRAQHDKLGEADRQSKDPRSP